MTRPQLEQAQQPTPSANANQRGSTFGNHGLAGADFGLADPAKAGLTERITLTSVLQKPVWGLLIGSALGALLVYGASGIIFFTNLILTSPDAAVAGLNRFVAIQNLSLGVSLFLVTWFLSSWLDRRFRTIWKRHLLYTLTVIPLQTAVSITTYFLFGEKYIN